MYFIKHGSYLHSSTDIGPSFSNHVLSSLSGTQLDTGKREMGSRVSSLGRDCDSLWVTSEILKFSP